MTIPKAILIDLDDTLYGNYAACNAAGINAACALLSTKLDSPLHAVLCAYDASRGEVHERLGMTASGHSRFLYLKGCIERIAGRSLPAFCYEAEQLFWQEFLETMMPRRGLTLFLEEAVKRACRMAIISDLTTHTQAAKLQRLGVDSFVDVLVTSEETGNDKPDKMIFTLALQRLGIGASDAVMIGDSFEHDVYGAQALGIRGILMGETDARCAPAGIERVRDFHELSAVLFPLEACRS